MLRNIRSDLIRIGTRFNIGKSSVQIHRDKAGTCSFIGADGSNIRKLSEFHSVDEEIEIRSVAHDAHCNRLIPVLILP